MTGRIAFALLLIGFCLVLQPMTKAMQQRPVEVKLGYLPHPRALKVMAADQKFLVAELATVKVLFYFGTLIDKLRDNVIIRPEFYNMYRMLQTASRLDPYNEDVYYFTQAAFTWELGRIEEVNHLLEYGMKYRTWDYWLPFYAGFNYAYFLKDYATAAHYMQRAAEISGNSLFTKLAARYFYESDQTSFGLTFLDAMIANAKDPAVKKTYQVRKEALLAVLLLEQAMAAFEQRHGQQVDSFDALIEDGLIEQVPDDPYGGQFFIDKDRRVRSTSKFANPNL